MADHLLSDHELKALEEILKHPVDGPILIELSYHSAARSDIEVVGGLGEIAKKTIVSNRLKHLRRRGILASTLDDGYEHYMNRWKDSTRKYFGQIVWAIREGFIPNMGEKPKVGGFYAPNLTATWFIGEHLGLLAQIPRGSVTQPFQTTPVSTILAGFLSAAENDPKCYHREEWLKPYTALGKAVAPHNGSKLDYAGLHIYKGLHYEKEKAEAEDIINSVWKSLLKDGVKTHKAMFVTA